MFPPLPALMVLAAPPAPVLPLNVAQQQILEAYEDGAPLPAPRVAPRDRAALSWTLGAAREDRPANPFPVGTAAQREAATLLALPSSPGPEALERLKLDQAGSHLLLWRWGQRQVREGAWSPAQRRAWEDRLLGEDGPGMTRGWALRHALCFALAEGDEGRFGGLQEAWGGEAPEVFGRFQRAFGLLGAPAPRLPLWTLPGLEPGELVLAAHPGATCRIEPLPEGPLAPPPTGTLWVVPSRAGSHPPQEPFLAGPELAEAQALAQRFQAAGLQGWLAPSRPPLEAFSFTFFPVLIRMDDQGRVSSIRMGDAARAPEPPQPTPIP